jgi:hypothetical protein
MSTIDLLNPITGSTGANGVYGYPYATNGSSGGAAYTDPDYANAQSGLVWICAAMTTGATCREVMSKKSIKTNDKR